MHQRGDAPPLALPRGPDALGVHAGLDDGKVDALRPQVRRRRRVGLAGPETGRSSPATAGKRQISMPSASVSRAGRPGRLLVTTSARCPAARHRRARFQVYRSTPPGVGRYWVVKKQKVISRCQRTMTASIMLRMTPHCTSASAPVRRAWAEASSGTAARRRGRQVSSRAGSTGRKYRPCRPYRVS